MPVAFSGLSESFTAGLPSTEVTLQTIEIGSRSTEPSGEHPLWKHVPSWFLLGEEDRIIPPALQRYMAERAQAQRTLAIEGASHAILVSRPDAALHPIREAAAQRVAA